jgi:hypothetical protein
MMRTVGRGTMKRDSSEMLYETTDGKWKLPGDPGRIQKPHGSISVFLNLVKLNLYVGNQPGLLFLTPPWYCLVVFHNHPYKNSMQQRNIYFIGKFQSKSVNYKRGLFKIKYMETAWHHQWYHQVTSSGNQINDIMGHLMFICPFCNKLANQIEDSHRKHPFDFQAANRNADSHDPHDRMFMWLLASQ